MNIYIPIEIKAREIEGRTLLALVAAERGHVVVLGGKEDTLGLARNGLLKPGIVHDQSLHPSPEKVAYLRETPVTWPRRYESGRRVRPD